MLETPLTSPIDRLATEGVIATYLRDIRPRRGPSRRPRALMSTARTPAHQTSFRGGRRPTRASSRACGSPRLASAT